VVDTYETRRLDVWIDVYDFKNIPPAGGLIDHGRRYGRREGGVSKSEEKQCS
jgi:hypothetical protein